VVVITGGGSGLGKLVAHRLAQKGAIIVTVDVNQKGNEETKRQGI
jgi:NAD(P)-dependent dehydrogenase (short-subunit alcohol dehydrogenase family)